MTIEAPPVSNSDSAIVERTNEVIAAVVATPKASGDLASFCAQAKLLTAEHETYVGSAQHRADVTSLVSVAPTELPAAADIYRQFIASGRASTDDPSSNLAEDWPPEVQAAIADIQAYIVANC